MELDELLIAAAEAPPDSRIELRDRIAAHGDNAIERLMTPAWIGDPNYAAFAIQAIRKAGEQGATATAIQALRQALGLVATEWHRRDVETALISLGSRPPSPRRTGARPSPASARISTDELTVGRCYRRSELHDGGLGGNRQKGISYPSQGIHCLLFSDPSKEYEHGYRDQPIGDSGYRYFGEWDGAGDMNMTGGNRAVVDRSPELYLFTAAACGHLFRGQFRLLSVDSEKATRDGREFNAIVFNLEKVDR